MKILTPEQRRKRRTFIYLFVLLALLILLVSATYTWFALSHTPRVSDMAMYVNASKGIELATEYDAVDEDWGQYIHFPDLVTQETPLKPVTWSEKDQCFKTIVYGYDGRKTSQWRTLNDADHANRNDGNGYYVVGSFYARSDTGCKVSLAEAVEVNEGQDGSGTYVIGTPVWNEQSILHDDGGSGAENAVRIGFRITPVDDWTGEEVGESYFIIYEPNCDVHLGGVKGYEDTPSIDGEDVLSPQMILQTASTWTEAYPVERNVTVKELGEFTTDTDLFELSAGEMVRIDLYIWLEGQDIDCTNEIQEAQIYSCIQFHTDYTNMSGLTEIP